MCTTADLAAPATALVVIDESISETAVWYLESHVVSKPHGGYPDGSINNPPVVYG
jgi:hypothetical protein